MGNRYRNEQKYLMNKSDVAILKMRLDAMMEKDPHVRDGTSYLMVARRLDEAAKSYELLTPVLGKWGMDYTLDNVQGFLFPKFRANIGAGRKDSALAVALQTFELLDSAIEHAKKSDAAELATVYETQQKETEIARQQADLSRQRWIGTLAASLLLTAFFVFYIIYRRRAQRRLAVTHERLQDTDGGRATHCPRHSAVDGAQRVS